MLELLVALAIMSAAFAIIWSTFSATVKAWTRGSELLENLRRGDFVMEQLVTGLRSAAFFDSAPGKYGFRLKDRGSGKDSSDTLSWVASGTAFLPPDSPLANGLHRLVVGIEDNSEGKRAVTVSAFPHLSDEDEDSVNVEKWHISTEVQGLSCEVYVEEDEDWKDEWEDTNSIPRLVHITLYMDPIEEYGDPVKLERLIEIPVAPPIGADKKVPTAGASGERTGEGEGTGGTGGGSGTRTTGESTGQGQEPTTRERPIGIGN